MAVYGGEVEGGTTGAVGFIGVEVVGEEDGEDGGVASVRGDVQSGHGVVGLGDFGVGGVAAGWAGLITAVATAFAVRAVCRVSSGLWRLLGCRWWDLELRVSAVREASLRI